MKWWKWLGLAGLAGVTATGVVVARAERRRRSYTPDEVRERLQQRLAEAAPESADGQASSTSTDRLPDDAARRRTSWRTKFDNRLRRAPR